MKLVVAVIRPERLSCVQLALRSTSAELMSVTETHSYSREATQPLIYRSAEIRICTSPKLRLDILADDFDVEAITDAILNACVSQRANTKNDGRVFVVSLDHFAEIGQAEREALPIGAR